jgi:hypothetical protein
MISYCTRSREGLPNCGPWTILSNQIWSFLIPSSSCLWIYFMFIRFWNPVPFIQPSINLPMFRSADRPAWWRTFCQSTQQLSPPVPAAVSSAPRSLRALRAWSPVRQTSGAWPTTGNERPIFLPAKLSTPAGNVHALRTGVPVCPEGSLTALAPRLVPRSANTASYGISRDLD